MPVISDRWIRRTAPHHGMIEPFAGAQKRRGAIGYFIPRETSYAYMAGKYMRRRGFALPRL